MRQAGFLAAAGIYALEHHIERLAEDHARASTLGQGLTDAGFVVRPVETNMVYVTVQESQAAVAFLRNAGIKASSVSAHELRLVTHLGIDDAHIEATTRAFEGLAAATA
jgi:threonine aldolase